MLIWIWVLNRVLQIMVTLAVKGESMRNKALVRIQLQGVFPSILADIWSENSVALLGVMAPYINDDWEIVEVLIKACPFSGTSHIAENIKSTIQKALFDAGLARKVEAEVQTDESLEAGTLLMVRTHV